MRTDRGVAVALSHANQKSVMRRARRRAGHFRHCDRSEAIPIRRRMSMRVALGAPRNDDVMLPAAAQWDDRAALFEVQLDVIAIDQAQHIGDAAADLNVEELVDDCKPLS